MIEPWTLWATSRSRHVAAGLSLVVLGAIGALPQFGGPGYEAALSAGIVLPAVAAVATALEVVRDGPSTLAALVRGVAVGLGLAFFGVVVVLIHGARVGFCDPSEGLLLYALGPTFGAVLGGAWGAAVGFVLTARRVRGGVGKERLAAIGLSLLGPLAGIAVSLVRFMTSPMVFAFDPFFGVFAGPLYDTVVNVVDRLVSYRLGSLATLSALTASALLSDTAAARGARAAVAERPGTAVLCVVFTLASLGHVAAGPRFGHWSSDRSIEAALGARFTGGRCDVIHSRGIARRDVVRFTRECDRTVPEIEAFFGTKGPARVRVVLFANAGEKGFLMGAEHTQIAKPWRAEIYLQNAPFPHPVLAHELAHVVAGSFARGPFRVAGTLGGLVPDPGRIEGFAVAAAPDEDDDLSSEEWARAMYKLGILPDLGSLFRLEFLGQSASKAYTVAGAFVSFVRDRHGTTVLRRWYAGEPLERLTGGKDLRTLEREFRSSLATRVIPERALATARARFERPPIFARTCPRIVDRALGEASQRLAAGDTDKADVGFRQALALDPENLDAKFGIAGAALRAGKWDVALTLFAELARAPNAPKPSVVRALETCGDILLDQNQVPAALSRYEEALARVFDTDRQRTLEVKSVAAGTKGQRAVVTLLIGDPELGPSWEVAAPLIQAWADEEPVNDLPPYLLGRNIANAGRYVDAAEYLDRSLSLPERLASVRREALRLRIVIACALEDAATARRLLAVAVADPELAPARRAGLDRLVRRTFGAPPASTTSHLDKDGGVTSPPATSASATSPTKTTATCPEGMVLLPGGKFWVGSNPSEGFSNDESPRYLTNLAPFCLDETEVTAGDYLACVSSGRCQAPENEHKILCNYGRKERESHPMNCVDWILASAFCRTLDARLPTEAEFEYAARGGEKYLDYPWGKEDPDGRTCWKQPTSCPIKSYPPGAFGLFDVSGNVWEWTDDWYGPYPFPPPDGTAKVSRGGSFSRRFDKWMHTRLRERGKPREGGAHLGFRCARTLSTDACPFGVDATHRCRHGVLDRECPPEKSFNGLRCAAPGEPRCTPGFVEKAGFGCLSAAPGEPVVEDVEAAASAVTREPSKEHDEDCRTNSRDRPHAFRYVGGSHAARNLVSRRAGCKNRDVGVGWNSTCCP